MYNNELTTGWAMIVPKDDKWSHKCLYDILTACEEVDGLRGCSIDKKGIFWNPTQESRRLQEKSLRKRHSSRYDRCMMESEYKGLEVCPRIDLDFHFDNLTTDGKRLTDWKMELPRLKNFNETKDMDEMAPLLGHIVKTRYVRCILIKADEYISLKQFAQFVKVLNSLGHTIVSTLGFKMDIDIGDIVKVSQKRPFITLPLSRLERSTTVMKRDWQEDLLSFYRRKIKQPLQFK